MSTNTTYRVVFKAELSDDPTGRIPEQVGFDPGNLIWSAYVTIIPGYSTLESIPNILAIPYGGLTNIKPLYMEEPYNGHIRWL